LGKAAAGLFHPPNSGNIYALCQIEAARHAAIKNKDRLLDAKAALEPLQ
jgi:hypothetical protein